MYIGIEHSPPSILILNLCLKKKKDASLYHVFHKQMHWHLLQDSCFTFCGWRAGINKLIRLLPWPTLWITTLHTESRTSDTCPPDLQNGGRTGTETWVCFPRDLKVSQPGTCLNQGKLKYFSIDLSMKVFTLSSELYALGENCLQPFNP